MSLKRDNKKLLKTLIALVDDITYRKERVERTDEGDHQVITPSIYKKAKKLINKFEYIDEDD